ncbi:MAG: alpha/beta hydrolase [Lewinella sp.]
MKIYLIPGLGYDHRIFEKLSLRDVEVEYLNWIEPRKQEAIGEYAFRLFANVPEGEDIVLIGHSLGGIVAQEIAAKRKIKKIILLSSVKSRAEIPTFFKAIKPLGLYRLLTSTISQKTVKYWGPQHGFSSTEGQELFKSMVGRHSNTYLQWALKALSGWTCPELPSTTWVFQIHGTDDQTFPFGLIEDADVVIEDGTHVMVYTEPKKVEKALLGLIGNYGTTK